MLKSVLKKANLCNFRCIKKEKNMFCSFNFYQAHAKVCTVSSIVLYEFISFYQLQTNYNSYSWE